MKTRKEMRTTATSATEKQQNMIDKQPSEANIKEERVIQSIPTFKTEEASVVKQEDTFSEDPILQLDEDITIKREDFIDEKLLSGETTSTEQNTLFNNCQSCNHQFSNKYNYRYHLMTVHKMKLEPLPNSKPKLKPQPDISPVVDDPTHNCRSCNYQFTCKTSYRKHLMTIHKMKLEPLQRSKPNLKARPNITPVIDDPNHNCRSCNYQFGSRQAYRRHLMRVHEIKLEPIGRRIPKLKAQPNILPVVNDPNHNCRSCNYRFARKENYRKHLMAVHKMKLEPLKNVPKLKAQPNIPPVADDPNHNCRSCNYQFASKDTYRSHLMAVHKMKLEPLQKSRPKPKPQPNIPPIVDDPKHNCRSCNYQFASKDSYRVHLKIVHRMKLKPLQKSTPRLKPQPNIAPIVEDPSNNCRSCNYQFVSRRAYRSHLMTVHKMKLEPLQNSRPKLKAQPDVSPVVDDPNHNCRSCNYQFSNRYNYRSHLMTVHEMKLKPLYKKKCIKA